MRQNPAVKRWGFYAVLATGVCLAVACGGDDSNSSGESGAAPFGLDDLSDDAEVTELELDLSDDFDLVTGVAALNGEVFGVTGDGIVLHSDDDGEWTQLDDVEGLDDSVYALTTVDDALLALTSEALVRSEDGVTWEPVETSGVDLGSLNTITRDDDELVALGGNSEGFTLYVSDDGEAWESTDTVGLADDRTYQGQFVTSLAARGSDDVASLGAEFEGSSDDVVFGIWTSSDGGDHWTEVGTSNDVEGLEELDQPNTDARPILLALDDGYLALAGDEDGEATVWRSENGAEWGDPIGLGGPQVSFPGNVDGAAVTEDGIVAMALEDDQLTIWTLSAD